MNRATKAARRTKHPGYREVVEINLDFGGEDRFEWRFPMVIEYEHYQQMRRTYAGPINGKSYEELADTFQDLLKFRNRRIDELVRAVWGHEPLAQTAGKVCEIVADVWPMQLVLRGKMAELKGLTLDQVNAVSGATIQ